MCPDHLIVNSKQGPVAVTETSGCNCSPEGNLGKPKDLACPKSNGGAKDLPKEGMRSMKNATKSI